MYAPALLLAVPLLAGSAAAFLLFDPLTPTPELLVAGASILGLIGALGAYATDDRATAPVLMAIAAALAGFSLGVSDARRVYATPLARWFEEAAPETAVPLSGVLVEDAAVTPSGASLLVDVSSIEPPHESGAGGHVRPRVSGGVRLSVTGTLIEGRVREWRAGRAIRVPAFLRPASTYLNPGTPDERPSLARKGIVLVGSVKSAALVEVIGRGSVITEAAGAVRAAIRRRIGARVSGSDPRAAGVATAVLIGDRSGLAPEDERRLQDAGTYHVIAISGGNIAILAIVATLLLRALFVGPRAASVLTGSGLVFYGMVAGGAASVERAIAVAVLVLLARALDHRVHAINVLAVAALLAVAHEPAVILDAGFQLSFGATLGILLGLPRFASPAVPGSVERPVWWWALAWAGRMLAATICAETALAPVSAALFGRVSFAGFFLNFAAIPLMTIVQIGGLVVAGAPAWAEPIARAAAVVVQVSATALLRSAAIVDAAPWLAHDVAPPVCWLIAAYYVAALALRFARGTGAAVSCYALIATLLLASPTFVSRDAVPPSSMPLRVVVLDVGQGDATAVVLPGGRALLVDTGGVAPLTTGPDAFDAPPGFDIGDRVVARVLRALGIRRLDGLVVTHGDPDHILGARGVLRHAPARTIWEGVPVPPHPGLRSLAAWARSAGVSWRTVQAGDSERFGEVEVRVLHPPVPDWERQRVRNEDSVVLEIRLGQVSVILPGDIGREGERAILPRLEPGRLVVLKAPHHGSATSSTEELLDSLEPAAVIFSAGRNNRFGHPHPAVVERYKAIGAVMFSTAEDGAVFVESDGERVEVRGCGGRRATFRRRLP